MPRNSRGRQRAPGGVIERDHKYRERCDPAEAIAAVARWHNERVAELVRAARTAAQGAGASGHDVETYARGIQNTLRGAVE